VKAEVAVSAIAASLAKASIYASRRLWALRRAGQLSGGSAGVELAAGASPASH
jgi:hypothetical protein